MTRERLIIPALVALAVALHASAAYAEADHEDELMPGASEVELLEHADALISRGALVEALAVARDPRIDPVRGKKLVGYIALRGRQPARALELFEEVSERDPDDDSLFLYMGLAHAQLEQWPDAVADLDRARPQDRTAVFFTVMGRALRMQREVSAAWDTLRDGAARYEGAPQLARELVLLQIDVGLFELVSVGIERLLATSVSFSDELFIAMALRRAGAKERAIELLEIARHRHPAPEQQREILPQLAYLYAVTGRPGAAGQLFSMAWLIDGRWAFEAAESFRVAGMPTLAERWNARVSSPEQRLRQRFYILTEDAQYTRAASLIERLERLNIWDEQVRRRSALVLIASAEYDSAERVIRTFPDASPARASLMRQLQTCRERQGGCL